MATSPTPLSHGKWIEVLNDDNGSLYTGQIRLVEGDVVEIEGEPRVRSVTYVMGSVRKGWRACFKGQGAVPVSAPAQGAALTAPVRWRVVTGSLPSVPQSPLRAVVTLPSTARIRSSSALPGEMGRLGLSDGLTIFGFDSAWTRTNRGAICAVRYSGGTMSFMVPQVASFAEAAQLIRTFSGDSKVCLVGVDQPLIVSNNAGQRPVEKLISRAVGRRGGGVQPANRGRVGMFSDADPIWEFLRDLGSDLDPNSAFAAGSGVFAVEVFPAAANISLFQIPAKVELLLKYNPDRDSFRLQDWKVLCERVGALAAAYGYNPLADWCSSVRMLGAPNKIDQDKLDSIICLLVIARWRRSGPAQSVVVGDLATGYMVIPADDSFAAEIGTRLSPMVAALA